MENKENQFRYLKIKKHAKQIIEGTARFNRLSLAEEQGRIRGGKRNVEASIIIKTKESSNSKIEQEYKLENKQPMLSFLLVNLYLQKKCKIDVS